MKPLVFQFSSFENKTYINTKLIEAIKRLGGKYDESKVYSPRATHLIVEKMECTEKTLCFIAAGKCIVTHSYLKHSLGEKRFLKEDEFIVSQRFKGSKLANVSLKWKNNIQEKKQNAPFFSWNVGCFLQNDDKSKALIRIIKAGYGSASIINDSTKKSSMSKFTLIIYDNTTKTKVEEIAALYKLPYYPFQAIPDYIMQCIISDLPVLPLSYYQNIETKGPLEPVATVNSETIKRSKSEPKKIDRIATDFEEIEIPKDDDVEVLPRAVSINVTNNVSKDFVLASSYKTLLLGVNMQETIPNTMDLEVECQFTVLWNNNAFYEALNLIISLDYDEMPSKKILVSLFKFFTEKSIKSKTGFSYDSMDDNIYRTMYNSIYSYLLNLILNHPPINNKTISLYSEVFDSLLPSHQILKNPNINISGIVDTLYLISVHDYILLNSTNDKTEECAFLLFQLGSDEVYTKLTEHLVKEKNTSYQIKYKLLQIISFSSYYCKKSNLYKKLSKWIADANANGDEEFKKLFIQLSKK